MRLPKNWAAMSYQLQDDVPTLWASVDPATDTTVISAPNQPSADSIP